MMVEGWNLGLAAMLALVVGGCGQSARGEVMNTGPRPSSGGEATDGGGAEPSAGGDEDDDEDNGSSGGQDGTDSDEDRFDVGSGPPSDPGSGCSADLGAVEDPETGEVLQACGAAEACYAGECRAGCEAMALHGGSIGCEFLLPTSPFYGNDDPTAEQAGPCHAMLIANAGDTPAKLELSRGADSIDVAAYTRMPTGIGASAVYDPLPASGIPAGEVAVVFLSHRPGTMNQTSLECPVAPAVLADTAVAVAGKGLAFELRTDTPVQLYDIIPFGGAASWLPSASLIYPASAWGTDYLVANPHDSVLFGIPTEGTQWVLAVASEDATLVRVRPSETFVAAGGLEALPAGAEHEYLLDAGESIQFTASADPTGSAIVADKPIGVFAGHTYLKASSADAAFSGQDSAHQQLPDVHALGHNYVGAGAPSRLPGAQPESVLYKIVGVADGTQLTYDPIVPPGAPTTLSAGQAVEFETRALFWVSAQDPEHPFSFTQYMAGTMTGHPGCLDSAASCNLGDDEWVVVVPDEQFLSAYPFFVDPTYGMSALTLTRVRGPNGFADVEIGCLGAVTDWKKAGTTGQYEVAHVELYRGGAGRDACLTAQHTAVSKQPFGLMVWGLDDFASYGYAGGALLRELNEVDVFPEG